MKLYIRSSCYFIIISLLIVITRSAEQTINYGLVRHWANKLGGELWHLGDYITRRKEVQDRYKQAQIVSRNGQKIVEDMAKDLKFMMESKVSAVKRIMDAAENTAISEYEESVNTSFQYFNAKEMIEFGEIVATQTVYTDQDPDDLPPVIQPKEILLTKKKHFFNEAVNTTISSVHVPTNVYDRAPEVIRAIKWSEALDSIFYTNYMSDPTLTWQYFGSSSGFLRQFPATKWEEDPIDLYDCRLRSWYIEAANSPKDMIILVDSSGSMTGQRKDIAKHVVGNILDTLGPNDYVNIFTYAEDVQEVVPCFKDILVQANMGNVRELKLALDDIETAEIANVSAALTKAFDLLEFYRTEGVGARCNQAIMLVSDGVPHNYNDIFEQYNWKDSPFKPVRVFTYLIGREVADVKEIKDMACSNQGFYVHLNTMAEVREEVLNYIPVVARPLVLWKHEHPVIWSQVYADVVDPKMTDWSWEIKECNEQKDRFLDYRKNKFHFLTPDEERHKKMLKQRQVINQDPYSNTGKYNFMTTVSVPVFDRRENATRVANLLGVAGADVPISEIKKYLKPFLLGVNGYAFIVTNNGFVLTHPDFRPVFQDILKPAYNTVDMVEVELMDDNSGPREFDQALLAIRDSIVNQSTGSKWIKVKYHLDEMRRVGRMKRMYFWTGIKNTPFSLVVTYPKVYGEYRLQTRSEDEIHRVHAKGENVLSFFSGSNWKIHPDWLYCKYLNEQPNATFDTPELELKHFLERMKAPGWKWPLNRTPPPPEHAIFCDRMLMQALVYDAKITHWFPNLSRFEPSNDNVTTFKKRFGITVAFVATHSGLTRWLDIGNDDSRSEPNFSETNNRAIDEIWYKRAIDQYHQNRNNTENRNSFVYSVPFDVGSSNDTLVTASHAIFHTDGGKEAPAAVVGFQFHHTALYTFFKNTTSVCLDSSSSCNHCFTEEIDCYVIDNNGYIVISKNLENTGFFFGEKKPELMQRLIDAAVFKRVDIYDYQAVCFMPKGVQNFASIVKTPLKMIWTFLAQTLTYMLWTLVQTTYRVISVYASEEYYESSYEMAPEIPLPDVPPRYKEPEFDRRLLINRTRPEPCDHKIPLYELNAEVDENVFNEPATQCEKPYVVTRIPSSNLILLVVDTMCPLADSIQPITTWPIEQEYINASLACHKLRTMDLSRKRPTICINKHHNESSIELCGHGNTVNYNLALILSLLSAIRLILN